MHLQHNPKESDLTARLILTLVFRIEQISALHRGRIQMPLVCVTLAGDTPNQREHT